MPDKPGKIGGKRVGGIKQTQETTNVEETKSVTDVTRVAKTGSVSGVRGAGNRRRPTRTMTLEEREKLLSMITEEADKLFKGSNIPAERREIIESAVRMAVDASLAEEDGDEEAAEGADTPD